MYKDAGYKVTDHFSLDGSLYRKQGTTFPIDVIVIEGKGETELKLPGVQPPRIYESYENLKEVLVYATKQQRVQPQRDTGVVLREVYSGQAVDTNISDRPSAGISFNLDDSVSARISQSDRESGGVFSSEPFESQSLIVNRLLDARQRCRPNVPKAGVYGEALCVVLQVNPETGLSL